MIKVAHVVGRLDRGGVETWLKDVILHSNKEKFRMDFILTKSGEGAYDNIVLKEGSKLNNIPLSQGILNFSWNLYKLFRKEKYNVVHTHLHFFSGYICLIAFMAGIRCRISHSHNDTFNIQKNSSFQRKVYYRIQRLLINLFSNKKIACSKDAGYALFRNNTYKIIYCGIDFVKFIGKKNIIEKKKILSQYNIPSDAIVIGHVGRFNYQKNHSFLIDIFYEITRIIPDSYLFLIGEGNLKQEIELKVSKLNLNNVLFLRGRDDVDFFMRDVFDIFLFPSLFEGLGIVLLEAQAAGLKCLISNTIPQEVIFVNENIKSLSLSDSPQKWAKTLLEMLEDGNELKYDWFAEKLNNSLFNIKSSVASLENLYNQCTGK